MTIPAVGPITALTWVLEVDDVARFHSVKQAVSYCGLCGAERSSAETIKRMPISKQRNKHLQSVLIEAAKLAAAPSPELALVYMEKQKGQRHLSLNRVASEACSLSPCGGPQWTRVRSGRRTKSSGSKPLRRTSRFIECNPPGPAEADRGDGATLPMPPSNCFGTGRKHSLNLSVPVSTARYSELSGSALRAGTAPRGTTAK